MPASRRGPKPEVYLTLASQAEKLNGRACMVGYFLALGVEKLTGAGLAEQQGSFLGLLSLHLVVFAVLLIPSMDRIQVQCNAQVGPTRLPATVTTSGFRGAVRHTQSRTFRFPSLVPDICHNRTVASPQVTDAGRALVQAFANLFEEATFYDRQWAATWDGQNRPSENQ
jgi:hypothetical protein